MKELEDRAKVLQIKYKKLREEKEKLELIIEQYTIDIEKFKKKIKEKEEENNLLKENFNKEVKKQKDAHDLEINLLKENFNKEVKKQKDAHDLEINLLKENFNKEVKKHDLEIQQLKNRLINSQYKYLDSVNECMELKKENSELKEKMNL